jgi:hypothetical protein
MRGKYYGNFPHLTFKKSGQVILERVKVMYGAVTAKIAEREARLEEAAKAANMGSAVDVLKNLRSISQGTSGAGDIDMNAGLAGKLRAEIEALNQDREEAKRLKLVADNLDPEGTFSLDFEELTYFGF